MNYPPPKKKTDFFKERGFLCTNDSDKNLVFKIRMLLLRDLVDEWVVVEEKEIR